MSPEPLPAPGAGKPVPTSLSVALLAAGLLPAVLTVMSPAFGWLALALDLAVLLLCAVDYVLAPRADSLRVSREVEPVLSAGVPNRVTLVLEAQRPVRGEARDGAPAGVLAEGHRQRFAVTGTEPVARLTWRLTPKDRGDLELGDAHLRLWGPLGLCARQQRVPLAQAVKVYPDLRALTQDALALASASDVGERVLRKPAEGREFESLREYRTGDDYRTIDWKATARRGRAMVRSYQPERNQVVLLMLDCGRHMAGRIAGRRKLDHAVDAALRLAKVCLDEGDQVGVVAFATEVKAFLPPRKGREHLRTLAGALYRLEAALEESDYGRALDLALARNHKRSLVVALTDLLDPETSGALVKRTLALRPRHLPMVVSLLDEDLEKAATDAPREAQDAYVRQAAARLEDEYKLTAARLRDSGALVVRAPASSFSAAAVNEYLRVKARGLL
ncbi:MAG TPA: DUF58 domain-containing protein [Myxococcaceae bacterium]|nr:DUF58 domain-containing protein [Myxococcaceae bacterium]